MRILFLTNFYPPADRGGYAQWCQEVAEGLRSRGHDLLVLTSDYHRNDCPNQTWVHRELTLQMEMESSRNSFLFFTGRQSREKANLSRLDRVLAEYPPDIVLIWGMWNLSRSLAAFLEETTPGLVVYYIGDYWPTLPDQFVNYWTAAPRSLATALPKFILKPIALRMLSTEVQPALRFEHMLFPTAFMREQFLERGIPGGDAEVIFGAVDVHRYIDDETTVEETHEILSLLYVGRLSPEKGIETAIEALADLVHRQGLSRLELTIVGSGEPEYESQLRQLADQKKVQSYVNFIAAQPTDALPAIYRQADALLFTSIWAEPFGRVIVEAMAAGLPVVGAATGGAAEIMVDEETALLFPPGDSLGLAAQLRRLVESPSLRRRLGKAGRDIALEKFDLQRMVVEIEAYLEALVRDHPTLAEKRSPADF